MEKELRPARSGPWELETLQGAFLYGDAVLDLVIVESLRWELRNTWMHPVLHLQANWLVAKANQSFKKAHRIPCSVRRGIFTNWWKLILVT